MKSKQKLSTEIYFSFQTKASRTNHNGECPIVFRIIYRNERKDVFTGAYIRKNEPVKYHGALYALQVQAGFMQINLGSLIFFVVYAS